MRPSQSHKINKIINNLPLISKPSQIAINVHLIITLPSDLILRHTFCSVVGWRLKRQLIDRQGRPGNTPPDVSTWWGMFTDLTSAAITSRQRIFFKAAVNQTRQNVYHCEFSRQIQTKLQPQTCLRRMFNKKKKNNLSDRSKKKSPVKLLRTGGIFPWYYQFPCTMNHFYDYFLLHFFFSRYMWNYSSTI